jgi:hypothetical protein
MIRLAQITRASPIHRLALTLGGSRHLRLRTSSTGTTANAAGTQQFRRACTSRLRTFPWGITPRAAAHVRCGPHCADGSAHGSRGARIDRLRTSHSAIHPFYGCARHLRSSRLHRLRTFVAGSTNAAAAHDCYGEHGGVGCALLLQGPHIMRLRTSSAGNTTHTAAHLKLGQHTGYDWRCTTPTLPPLIRGHRKDGLIAWRGDIVAMDAGLFR